MSFKKGGVSFICWTLLLLGTGAAAAFFAMALLASLGLHPLEGRFPVLWGEVTDPFWQDPLAAGVLALAICLAVCLAVCLALAVLGRRGERDQRGAALAAEAVFAVCVLAAGALLRFVNLERAGEDADYFQWAMVTGDPFPDRFMAATGMTGGYLYVLHGILYLLGNRYEAGIVGQILLQLAGSFLAFLGVRKMAGRETAGVLWLFLMLAPVSVKEGLTYSPRMLYFVLYGMGLFLTGSYLSASARHQGRDFSGWVLGIVTGLWIGLTGYFDAAGFTLALFLLWLPFVNRKERGRTLWAGQAAVSFGAALGSFFLLIFWEGGRLSGTSFGETLRVWGQMCAPRGLRPVFWLEGAGCESLAVWLFCALGLVGFARRKKEEIYSPWVALTLGIGALLLFGMSREGSFLWQTALWTLSCAGVWEFFRERGRTARMTAVAAEAVTVLERSVQAGSVQVQEPAFLENPLPVPKKHVKKSMEYALEPEESRMHFDIDVEENDDYDI